MNSDKKIVAIYTRVSTLDQAREGHSLLEQEERIKKVCEANDYSIFKVYTDAGISAKDTNRPAYQQMLRDMKAKKFNMIFAYKMDRLSRSIVDFEEFFNLTEKYNCGIELYQEKIDTKGATGMLFARILALFAQFEREVIKERTLVGVESAANKGHFGGKPPFGYKANNFVDSSGNTIKQWIVNEEEAKIVKEIYELCIGGNSYFNISTILKEKYPKIFTQFKTDKKTGEKYPLYRTWTDGSISKILNNKIYIGIYEFRKTIEDKETIEIVDKIPPIISEETYEEAQTSIQRNSKNYTRTKEYLFSQKLICPKCGRVMACNGTRKKNGNEYLYYKCKDCGAYVRQEYIEQAVINELNDLFELHLALDKNCYPVDTETAIRFNKAQKHDIRFSIDKSIINEKNNSDRDYENICNIWKITSYEAKRKFINDYIDNIVIEQYVDKKTKIVEVKLANFKLRKDKMKLMFELKENNLIDDINSYGKFKTSTSYMSEKEAEEYIKMIRSKYNIQVHRFNSIEDQIYFENTFKYIVVQPKKAIEKYKFYELVLCEPII